MTVFPLDNTEYEAKALGAWCGTRTRGVFSADGHYAVSANGGMAVSLSPGLAWLKADTHFKSIKQALLSIHFYNLCHASPFIL